MNKQQQGRSRNWVFVLFLKSATENWKEIINEYGVPWAHSPLHDKDIEEDGNKKQSHYHIVMKFNNLKSYTQMLSLARKIGACNPDKVESLVAKVRYFTHRDSPNKYQYDEKEIQAFNGLDIHELLKPSKTETHAILREIRKYIRENNIKELADVYDYADQETALWSKVIDKNVYSINGYISSRRFGNVIKNVNETVDSTILNSSSKLYIDNKKNLELMEIGLREYQEFYECQYLC